MSLTIPGLHHVTVVAGDPQRNLDFYAGVLGLRLIKRTVNFDAPDVYHLYYGDDLGRPGTIITFFPFPGAARGRRGAGQATTVAFSIPAGALDYWTNRLKGHGLTLERPETRLDGAALRFVDHDGLQIELVAGSGRDDRPGCAAGPVPVEHAIRGFDRVTLSVRDPEPTARFLTRTLGLRVVDADGDRVRYAAAAGGPGTLVDVVAVPDAAPGVVAAGTVHHIAWRTPDDEQEKAWQRKLRGLGYDVTDVRDRQYFHSIYFNEPGGVLFEIATDVPGFAVDESPDALGTALKLPPWLEPQRPALERALPPLTAPTATADTKEALTS